MLKRLVLGLVLGTVIGAAVAAALVQGLGMVEFGHAVYAYVAAAVTGVLTGLVAGKPIWSADGKIEAGLKAFFGALLALGGMFALRTWVHLGVDLDALKAGAGTVGELPAASLPIVAAVLAMFFELDNTPSAEPAEGAKSASSPKLEAGKKVRVSNGGGAAVDDEAELDEPASAKKKSR